MRSWLPQLGNLGGWGGLVLCAVLTLGASAAAAHHSFAMYDSEHQIKLTGTVMSFMWSNPHVYIELAVREDRGTTNTYIVECASPGILDRLGWRVNLLKPGDQITVIIAPRRNGDPGGLLKQLTLPDGRKLSDGPLAGEPNIE
jgi:hypothetical protein